MKKLSMQRPLPSIEILTAERFRRWGRANDLNWLPLSLFMISGGPKRWRASFNPDFEQRLFPLVDHGRMHAVICRRLGCGLLALQRPQRDARLASRVMISALRLA